MSNKVEDNMNYIDDAKGRKYSIGNLKYIGEFTLFDLIICLFAAFISISLYFVNIYFGILMTFIIYSIVFGLISEYKTLKAYERFINKIKFKLDYKNISLDQIINQSNEDNIYEVISGFDIYNMSKKDLDKINNSFNHFFESILGRIKIYKFNSTIRIDEIIKKYQNLIDLKDPDNKKINNKLIISSYKDNTINFKEYSMPNFYIKFLDMQDDEINNLINKFKSIIKLNKIKKEEFKIIQNNIFENETKIKILAKGFKTNKNEYSIGKINFGRKVPSYWLQSLIINPNISFVVQFKNPSFNEKEKIKKSIKRWSKTIQNESIEEYVGKDFFETKKKFQLKQAKNEIMINNIIGKNEIKLINSYILIKKDKNDPLSFKKQINDIDFENDKILNINIDLIDGMQINLLKEFFLDKTNETKWYPTNSSTISNAVIFQNQSFININGSYFGTVNEIFPFIYDSWKEKNSGNHTGILAKTGAGKSILMKKLIISDEVMSGTKQYILDPKNDGYDEVIAKRFNWEIINVNKMSLNPLFINSKTNSLEEEINNKSINIQEWLYILFEKEIQTKEINNISLFSEHLKMFLMDWYSENKDEQATFSLFEKWINKNNIKANYELIFTKLIKGTYSRFNTKNISQISNKSIVFNLLEVFNLTNESIKNAILFLIINLINDFIFLNKNKKEKISLWIDEAGDFFKSNFLVRKIETLIIKARSFNTKICWATQNPTDLIDQKDKFLNSIFANTENLFIGQIKDNQIGSINKMLENAQSDSLTIIEKEWINDSTNEKDKGKFLYFNSNQRYRIKIDYENDIYFKFWNEKYKESQNRK